MDGEEVDVMADGLGVFGIYTEATNDFEKGMIRCTWNRYPPRYVASR